MPWIDVNRDGINAKLALDPKLTREDREFLFSQTTGYANTRRYVRVRDSPRIRRLLDIPADIQTWHKEPT